MRRRSFQTLVVMPVDLLLSAVSVTEGRRPLPCGTDFNAQSVAGMQIMPINNRCHWIGKLTEVKPFPIPAPTKVPRLKQPCSIGSRGRWERRSTSAPSTLIAISAEPIPAPNRHSPAETVSAEEKKAPSATSNIPAITKLVPAAMTGLVPLNQWIARIALTPFLPWMRQVCRELLAFEWPKMPSRRQVRKRRWIGRGCGVLVKDWAKEPS